MADDDVAFDHKNCASHEVQRFWIVLKLLKFL